MTPVANRRRLTIACDDNTRSALALGLERGRRSRRTVAGVIVPTTVDAEVARAHQPFEGTPFEISIDRIEPERLFAFRWHPFAVEPSVDYSREPTTLIEFLLEDVPDGVMLTIRESGFDRVPLERRAKAFGANEAGWAIQMRLIEKYLAEAT
jgi:uncharacterized protein YndB with AHSA1/START domain